MSQSKRVTTAEEALEYFFTLDDSESEEAELCILPPDENANLTDEEFIREEDLQEERLVDVCGEVDLVTRACNSSVSKEVEVPESKRLRKARTRCIVLDSDSEEC